MVSPSFGILDDRQVERAVPPTVATGRSGEQIHKEADRLLADCEDSAHHVHAEGPKGHQHRHDGHDRGVSIPRADEPGQVMSAMRRTVVIWVQLETNLSDPEEEGPVTNS